MCRYAAGSRGGQFAAPVPESDDVDLLCALDDARAVNPIFDRAATLVTEVEGEENRAT